MLNKVEICGVNTAKLPVLSGERTMELFRQMQQGSPSAREELISGNLRLVLSVLQRFNNRGENADDLFQVGCIGLIKAIDNFDLSQNVRLSTYAVPMIIGEIRRYLRDNNAIRVSRSLRDLAYKAMQARESLVAALGREPKVEEIAARLELPPREVLFALDAIADPISLNEPIYNNGGDPIYVMDQISDEKNSEKICDFTRDNIFHQGVYCEITAHCRLLRPEKRIHKNLKITVASACRVFPAGHCYINIITAQAENAETRADFKFFADAVKNALKLFGGYAVNLNVNIFVFNAEQFIAHHSAHIIGLSAEPAYKLGNFFRHEYIVAAHITATLFNGVPLTLYGGLFIKSGCVFKGAARAHIYALSAAYALERVWI